MNWPHSTIRPNPAMRCNFNCVYCSNHKQHTDIYKANEYEPVDPALWVAAFGRLKSTARIIFGSGELWDGLPAVIDSCWQFQTGMYTNASTRSMENLMKMAQRGNLYLYISYHPGQIELIEFANNVQRLKDRFNVYDCHTPEWPEYKERIKADKKELKDLGVDLQTVHDLNGIFDGKMYYMGDQINNPAMNARFRHRTTGTPKRDVLCRVPHNNTGRTMGYPIAPNGDIYLCWRHLFAKDPDGVLGNFFDESFELDNDFHPCSHYGDCHIGCAYHRDIMDEKTGAILDEAR